MYSYKDNISFLCNSRLMLGYMYHTYGCTQIHQWYLEICLLICTRNDVEYSRSFSDTCKLSCVYIYIYMYPSMYMISIICIYVSSVYLVIYKIRVFLICNCKISLFIFPPKVIEHLYVYSNLVLYIIYMHRANIFLGDEQILLINISSPSPSPTSCWNSMGTYILECILLASLTYWSTTKWAP